MGVKIVYLDDSEELRFLMARLIEAKLKVPYLCLDSFKEFEKYSQEILNTRAVILDINLGLNQPTGIDAFHWLNSKNYKGKVFFLTGHARSHPDVIEACKYGAELWEKPILSERMFNTLNELMNESI